MIPPLLAAYQLLEVAPWASLEEVSQAYRQKAKKHHPDLHVRDERRTDTMVRLNRARAVVFER